MFSMPLKEAAPALEWRRGDAPVPYPEAVAVMEERVRAIREGAAAEQVWLLEHPPLYTAGTSAKTQDLLAARFPVYPTGRGGQYTYHGPGQRVAYLMLDLKRRATPKTPDLREYVRKLESWLIASLAQLGVEGFTRPGRVGIWVREGTTEAKIAAIGVRVRGWVSYHGVCINVQPDLSHYSGIVPCGVREYGVTSLARLGISATLAATDEALMQHFPEIFD